MENESEKKRGHKDASRADKEEDAGSVLPSDQEYLESFTQELDPRIVTECRLCPPDKRPPGLWCEWEFKFPEEKV